MQRWRQERLNDELVAAADESAVGETETDGRARPMRSVGGGKAACTGWPI